MLSLKEAGVHLADLDESGNTGTNLNDKEQPIFLLAALIVPEAAWQRLERDLEQAITRHIPKMAYGQEIPAVDLRSGRGAFAGSPVGRSYRVSEWRVGRNSGQWPVASESEGREPRLAADRGSQRTVEVWETAARTQGSPGEPRRSVDRTRHRGSIEPSGEWVGIVASGQ